MTEEPEPRNEISGQVSGSAWQIGHVHGDLNHTVHNTKNAPLQQEEPELDIWLVLAGVLAVAGGVAMMVGAFNGGTAAPRLVGVGVVLDVRAYSVDHAALSGPTLAGGTWVVVSQWHVHVPAGVNVFSSFLPTIGVLAMLLASSSIRERVSAPGA